MEISCTSTRAYAQRVVILQPGYRHSLMSDSAVGKNIQFTNHILSRPKFVNSSDRDRSVSPGKSTMGDRNDGSRKWMSPGSNYPPLSARTALTKVPTLTTHLSLALQQVLHFRSR